jgi:DNA-binding transcriptional ArsR family regulator
MTEHIDDIKKELEEVRKLKEELKREVEETKRQNEENRQKKEGERKERDKSWSYHYSTKPPRPPREPKPVRPLRPVKIDIAGITDSLEDMMEDLGRSIETSFKDIDGFTKGFKIPGVHIRTGGKKERAAKRKDIEMIPPDRIAKIVAPLGSEERLGILDFLKSGGKPFNEIENFTGKTGSSLTHHLNPLVEAGYVVKGEVGGKYYVTVEGRLAYRLAQWLTHRVEQQREYTGNNGANGDVSVDVEFDEPSEDEDSTIVIENEEDLEAAAEHLGRVAEKIDEVADKIDEAVDKIEEVKDEIEEAKDEAEAEEDDEDDDEDDLDDLDWED